MQKKLNSKMTLSKETLRNLSPQDLEAVNGGATSTCGTSNSVDSCDTCITCSRRTC
jgi:hypothetical protein